VSNSDKIFSHLGKDTAVSVNIRVRDGCMTGGYVVCMCAGREHGVRESDNTR